MASAPSLGAPTTMVVPLMATHESSGSSGGHQTEVVRRLAGSPVRGFVKTGTVLIFRRPGNNTEFESRLPVGLPAMEDAVDREQLAGIVNCEEHSVVTDSQAIAVDSAKLFDLRSARLQCQQFDALEDQPALSFGQRAQIPLDARVVGQTIHGLNELVGFQLVQQCSVGQGAAAGPNSPLEGFRIGQIFNQVHEFAVVHD